MAATSRLCWVFLVYLGLGCADPEPSGPAAFAPVGDAPPVVRTTTYPLAWMAERIGGGAIQVELVVPADADPATWRPDDAALQALQGADLVVLNGAGFEALGAWASLPPSRLVDTAAGFRHRWLQNEHALQHSHGPNGHAHTGLAGHTWMDPVNARAQAEALRAGLVRRFPALAGPTEAGLAGLRVDLDALHRRLTTLFAAHPRLAIASAHPAYAYLARRYELGLVSLHLDPEGQPAPPLLADACTALRRAKASILLWETPPRPAVAATWEARCGVRSVVFSPLEHTPEAGDYLTLMNANVDRLEAALNLPALP